MNKRTDHPIQTPYNFIYLPPYKSFLNSGNLYIYGKSKIK